MYRVTPSDDKNWNTIPGFIWWKTAVDGFQIRFDHKFNWKENQSVYFAYSLPFGYNDWISKIDQIQKSVSNCWDIYFHRELLVHSLEK